MKAIKAKTSSATFVGYDYLYTDTIVTRHGDLWQRDHYRSPQGGVVMDFTYMGMLQKKSSMSRPKCNLTKPRMMQLTCACAR